MNAEKCHLLITNYEDNISIKIDNEIIKASKTVKLLGIKMDNRLKFDDHVSDICNKVSRKLHALAHTANVICKDKLCIILKSFIESQFSYCQLIWMFHSRTTNNSINRLHERALRLVYKNETLSFEELLELDTFTINHRKLHKLATEMYKIKNNITCIYAKSISCL